MSDATNTQQQEPPVLFYIADARHAMKEHGVYAHIAATFLISRFSFVSAVDGDGDGADAEADGAGADAVDGAEADADSAEAEVESGSEADGTDAAGLESACDDDTEWESADMPAPSQAHDEFYTDLVKYIAYILWQAELPEAILHGALYLLQKRKNKKSDPPASGGAHALFLTAYSIANDVLNDEVYDLKGWRLIGSDIFELREMATFKREFCMAMDWELNIRAAPLKKFLRRLAGEFAQKDAKLRRARPAKSRAAAKTRATKRRR